MPAKLTTEEFVKRSRTMHGKRYDYSSAKYENADKKVVIICKKHGPFEQRAMDHMKGRGCSLCNEKQPPTTETFIKKATATHNNKYSYDQVKYKNTKTKVLINCPDHGYFSQTPCDHLTGYGCPTCGGTQKRTTEDFIQQAMSVHGSEYDYSRTVLDSMNKKVDIICKDHGVFQQRPADHVNGSGCPACSLFSRGQYSEEYFLNHPEEKNTKGILYIVKVEDRFCKVGITKRSVSQRFANKKVVPVSTYTTSLYEAYTHEQRILDQYKHHRYRAAGLSSRSFTGWTECFPLSILSDLNREIESLKGKM